MFGHGKKLIKAGLTFLTLSQIPLLILGLVAMLGIEISFVDLPEINFSVQGAILFGLVVVSLIVIGIASSRNKKYGEGKAGFFAPFSMVFFTLLVVRVPKLYDVIIRNEGMFGSLFKNNFFLSVSITSIISLYFFVTLLIAELKARYIWIKISYFLSHFALLFMMYTQVSHVTLFLLTPMKPLIISIAFMVSAGFELFALFFIFLASLVLGYSSGLKQIDEFGEKARAYEEAHKQSEEQPKQEPKVQEKPANLSNEEPESVDIAGIASSYMDAEPSVLDDPIDKGAKPTVTKFTCPNCCASFDAKPDECPYCGSKFNWKK